MRPTEEEPSGRVPRRPSTGRRGRTPAPQQALRTVSVLSALLLALTACSGHASVGDAAASPTHAPTQDTASSSTPAPPAGSPFLDGPVPPGRHLLAVMSTCAPTLGCPTDEDPALPTIDVAVPGGWVADTEVASLFPAPGRDTTSRNAPALVLGWTNHWVGLNSQPCSPVSHQDPDIEVGHTVSDFVDAVVAHPLLDVTQPTSVRLGSYRGQFLSLTGPKDISDCEEWRPWDPGPYLQGEENRWDLWVIDVDGVRVVVMAQYFPETPPVIKDELRAMARSIRFAPGTS